MKTRICLVPKLGGLGGMVSFQSRFIQGLIKRAIPYTFNLSDPDLSAVLVIGGTRQLWKLWRAKQRGVKIVQRLDGMNWLHKIEKTPIRAFLRAEINNWILAYIRRNLADYIVYQSEFSRDWWENVYGSHPKSFQVTYNGIDLSTFNPRGSEKLPVDRYRILLVEGHLSGANARGLVTAARLAGAVKNISPLPIELMVVGDVNDTAKALAYRIAPNLWITWRGVVAKEMIPSIDREAHVLFSADLNAACPNSVIEALACGLPVAAYDTGALVELIREGAGEIVPYGANHWKLEEPVIQPLAEACAEILINNHAYRVRARKWAEAMFDLDNTVDAYLEALEGVQ